MKKKIVIIGNGFDIGHELPTKYLDLMFYIYDNDITFLKNLNEILFQSFEKISGILYDDEPYVNREETELEKQVCKKDPKYNKDGTENRYYAALRNSCYLGDCGEFKCKILWYIWNNLEKYLYLVFLENEVDAKEMEYNGIKETIEAEEIGQVCQMDIEQIDRPANDHLNKMMHLKTNFDVFINKWIYDIDCSIKFFSDNICNEKPKFSKYKEYKIFSKDYFSENDLIINFNYSKTIEYLYGINNVCHIHGESSCSNKPIMGHTNDSIKSSYVYEVEHCIDGIYYTEECADDAYYLVKEFYKDYNSILTDNDCILQKCVNYDSISIIGMSYSETDFPYLKTIKEKLTKDEIWTLYYYSDEDKSNAKKYQKCLGLDDSNSCILNVENLFTNTVYLEEQSDSIND